MVVYPANTLVEYARADAKIFLIDPNKPDYHLSRDITFVGEPAGTGVPQVVEQLMKME